MGSVPADCAVLLALIISGLLFTRALPSLADVTLWDEAGYLERGLLISRHLTPDVQYGPVYSLYYWLLSRFVSDPVQIQFAAYVQTAVFLPPAFYACMRLARVPLRAAWPLAAFSILSYANLQINTRVEYAALIMLLVPCGLAMRTASLATAVRWLLGSAFLASYVRPEFLMSFLLLLPVWIYAEAMLLGGQARLLPAWKPLALVLGMAVPFFCLGVPAFASSGGREMLAFSQHFSIRWVRWNRSGMNPYFCYPAIISEAFGNAHSPWQALRADPREFARFVSANLGDFLKNGPRIFLLHFELPAWAGGRATRPWVGVAVLCAVALDALRSSRAATGSRPVSHRWLLVPILLPAIASSLLVYPTEYYYLPLGFIGVAGVLSWAYARSVDSRPAMGVVLAGVALQLAITPGLADTEFTTRQRPNISVIDHLRGMHLKAPLHILESDGGYHVFLLPMATWVQPYGKGTGFDAFCATNRINVIIAGDYLKRDSPQFKDDPEWRRFLQNPGRMGFTRDPDVVSGREFFYRNDSAGTP